ncbi:MAG: hypothetical protein NTZ01_01020, partial [Verrucomicrobia bacterium]|nr:hypothetical protein [Verrucomicrobiota bacterium]
MTAESGFGLATPASPAVGEAGIQGILARTKQALADAAGVPPAERLERVRQFIKLEQQRLAEQARAGIPGLELAHQRSQLLSAVLVHLWEQAGGSVASHGLVMGAVGGFGRQEMSPASDIDLVFIREGTSNQAAEEVVKQILYVLWDIGCKVGHACRTIPETIERAEAEPLIKTALLDARRLAGSERLWKKLQTEYTRRSQTRHVEEYLSWRLENQSSRHTKEGKTVFVQEPNIKTGVGGLRDFHNLRWVGRMCGEGGTLEELVQKGWLGVVLRKSEALMREVYGHMQAIHLICNPAATRLCQQRTGKPRGLWSFFSGWKGTRRAADGFVLTGAELGAENPQVFSQDPARMIRVFRILQDQGSVPSVELTTLLRSNFSLLTEELVQQKEVQETFLHILRQKGKVARILRLMHENGVLGRMIPEFAPLTCLVQHEFFHRYTADEHTLVCLEQLDAMLHSDEPDLRKYAELYARVEVPEILALAVLLHDTGKAELSRNHEEMGAVN